MAALQATVFCAAAAAPWSGFSQGVCYPLAPQAELKSWTANRIGDLTQAMLRFQKTSSFVMVSLPLLGQTRDSDCLEIAECILENEDLADPEALKACPVATRCRPPARRFHFSRFQAWLSPFVTEGSAKHKAKPPGAPGARPRDSA